MHRPAPPSILSPRTDFAWFVGPGLLAALWGTAVGLADRSAGQGGSVSVGLWIVAVLLVDVAHVYASLYRTYLDPEARRLHRKRLVWIPILCAWIGFLLHLESPLLFWGVLAYVAIFHFIKQHIGFALLYVRSGGEARIDRTLTRAAIWAGTAAPVIYWHAHLPTRFAWFVDGDLLTGLPRWLGEVALLAELPVWLAFAVRRIALWRRGRTNAMVPWLVLIPAVNWHLGIVAFDDDRVFTITNVFGHGVPYLALVWAAGGRERVGELVGRVRRRSPPVGPLAIAALFYGLLALLAISEEALWDRLVWHDHPQLFGEGTVSLGALATAAVVALLTVPQATHYVLDRYIWRVGPDNPRLAAQLGLGRPPPP